MNDSPKIYLDMEVVMDSKSKKPNLYRKSASLVSVENAKLRDCQRRIDPRPSGYFVELDFDETIDIYQINANHPYYGFRWKPVFVAWLEKHNIKYDSMDCGQSPAILVDSEDDVVRIKLKWKVKEYYKMRK